MLVAFSVLYRELGSQSFGLVGLFTVVQAWLMLVEMGIGPTLSREVAIAQGDRLATANTVNLLLSFDTIFCLITAFISLTAGSYLTFYGANWIQSDLDGNTVSACVFLMLLISSAKWFSTLYKSILVGFNDLFMLNVLLVGVNFFRFVAIIPLIYFFEIDILDFFIYQFYCALLEVLAFKLRSSILLHMPIRVSNLLFLEIKQIRRVKNLTLSIASTSILWALLTQTDKLMLSGFLDAKDYGFFTFSFMLCSAVIAVTMPYVAAIQPQILKDFGRNDHQAALRFFRVGLLTTACIGIFVAAHVTHHSLDIIEFWSGDINAALWSVPIVEYYSIGYAALPIYVLCSYFSVASGRLASQALIYGVTLVAQIITYYITASIFGVDWVARSFALLTAFGAVALVIDTHSRIKVPGQNLVWIWKICIPFIILMSICINGFLDLERVIINLSNSLFGQISIALSSWAVKIYVVIKLIQWIYKHGENGLAKPG